MICQLVLMAGTMASGQATYYAETCYVKSITFPILTANCVAELPDREDEFNAALYAWQRKYQAALDLSKSHLQSVGYDFHNGLIPMSSKVADNWLNGAKQGGRAEVEDLCNGHFSDLKS